MSYNVWVKEEGEQQQIKAETCHQLGENTADRNAGEREYTRTKGKQIEGQGGG